MKCNQCGAGVSPEEARENAGRCDSCELDLAPENRQPGFADRFIAALAEAIPQGWTDEITRVAAAKLQEQRLAAEVSGIEEEDGDDEDDEDVYIREALEELAAEAEYMEAPALVVLPAGWPASAYELGQEVSVVADGGSTGMITGIKLDLTDGHDVPPCATWMYLIAGRWWEARELSSAEPEEETKATGDTTDDFDPFLDADDLP